MNILENKFFQILLFPLSLLYGFVMRLRNFCYDHGLFQIRQIPTTKVISIGNISTGGTGKTPFAIFLANYLQEKGIRVAILSRGYRRKSKGTVIVSDGKSILADVAASGDEPYLMALNLTNVPIVCESDRVKGGLLIAEKFHSQVIILDDGFQHRRLHRNLDIVLFDASKLGENLRTLPAGNLREPISGIKRADLVCLTRIDQVDNINQKTEKLKKLYFGPIVLCRHVPRNLISAKKSEEVPLSQFRNKNIIAFSGIANPKSFKETLRSLQMKISDYFAFPDHYDYSISDIEKMKQSALKNRAEAIITTEKDFIRLLPFTEKLPENLYYLTIEIQLDRGKEFLEKTLKTKMPEIFTI